MAQVSNVQSRTLRVVGSLPEEVKTTLSSQSGVVVLEKESSSGRSKTFVTAEEISPVIQTLSTNNVTFRPHFYSLFAKFNSELKTSEGEKLNDKVWEVTPDAEISYSRVDENGHTGKIVVDRFEDYNTLRSHEGEITFYKFNRTKAQSKGPIKSQNQEDDEGFTTVKSRQYSSDRKPRTTGDREYKPRQQTGDREYKPRTTGDREYKPRQQTGDREYKPRNNGEYKPRQQTGDREYKPRHQTTEDEGERKPRQQYGDRKPRTTRDVAKTATKTV